MAGQPLSCLSDRMWRQMEVPTPDLRLSKCWGNFIHFLCAVNYDSAKKTDRRHLKCSKPFMPNSLLSNYYQLLAPYGALRGGTNKTKVNFFMVPRWILLSLQYIRMGKKEFLNLVTVLTLHIDPQYLKNHYIRVKNQNCRRPMVWPIKTCARRALSQRKKN